jgi:hypothetical protein
MAVLLKTWLSVAVHSVIMYNKAMEEVKLGIHHKCPGLMTQSVLFLDDSVTSHTAAGVCEWLQWNWL